MLARLSRRALDELSLGFSGVYPWPMA